MKLHKPTSEKCYFYLIFSFSLMYISNLATYYNLINTHYKITQGHLTFILDNLKFLNVIYIIQYVNLAIFEIIFFASFAYFFILFLLFIVNYYYKLEHPKKKIHKFFFARWYVNLAENFIWLLYFPCTLI